MNPSKRIQPHTGPHSAARKAPTNKIVAGKAMATKGGAMKAARPGVKTASRVHGTKSAKKSGWKGMGNC